MNCFNAIGLVFVAAMMIPNVIFAIKSRDGFRNMYHNKFAEMTEQISRYACIILMVFNIPYTWTGFWFPLAKSLYIIVNAALIAAYLIIWAAMNKRDGMVRAVLLSAIPSLIFFFSGVMLGSILLTVSAVFFAVSHILISVKNAQKTDKPPLKKKILLSFTSIFVSFAVLLCAVSGGAVYLQSKSLSDLTNMSAAEMIDYCCTDKNAKISVATIEAGEISYCVYGQNAGQNAVYDYEIGSVSKTFVGLMFAKAVSEGKVSLSDSISVYLDLEEDRYFPTLERLLTHTSGYAPYYFEWQMAGNRFAQISNDFYGIGKDALLKKVKNIRLENKDYPFAYSNFGLSVAGLVLEKIYGKEFTALMNEYIREELFLTNTKAAKQSGNLEGYWKWSDGDSYLPAGSIISNITDMADYLSLYLGETTSYFADTYRELKKIDANHPSYEQRNIRMDSVGMTWMIDNKNDIIWHNGGTTAYNNYMGFYKDKSKGVVILSNLSPNEKISATIIGAKLLLG